MLPGNCIRYPVIQSSTPLIRFSDLTTNNSRKSGDKTGMSQAPAHILGSPTLAVDDAPSSSSLLLVIHSFEIQSINVDFISNQLLLLKDKPNNDIIDI